MPETLMTWISLCTFLLLLMQAGFACFEAGLVRAKNSINVAIKNVADLGTSIVLFMFIGYPLMFGTSIPELGGLVGWSLSPMLSNDPQVMLISLFQAMFAGTAITIVSGAVSERTSFQGYLAIAAVLAIAVYPVSGHWAWGPGGWLNEMGFYDFAGGTVVHVVGGAIALAAVIIIGPRIGRFDTEDGIEPFNLAIAALGAFLLMFGWFGFNCGGGTDFEREIPLILVNTAVGACAGIVASLGYDIVRRVKPDAVRLLTAMIGGLVGITAGCAAISPLGAAALGTIGAATALYGTTVLERIQIDDPVGAIPVHMVAGIAGTILIPVFAYDSAVPAVVSSRWEWFGVQVLGCVSIAAFAFTTAYIFIRLTNPIIGYRVSAEDERVGLNIAEHDAGTGLLDLLNQMAAQGKSGDFRKPVVAEPETEAAYFAAFYNEVRSRFLSEAALSDKLLQEAHHLAHHDPLTGLANRRAFSDAASRKMSEIKRSNNGAAVITLDVDHFKSVNDTHGHDVGDEVLCELARRMMQTAREHDVVARMGGEEFAILIAHTHPDEASAAAERFRCAIAAAPFPTAAGPLPITASFGVCELDTECGLDATLKACDLALYKAKESGRNCVEISQIAA